MIQALQGTSQMARRGVEPREPLPGNGERPLGTDEEGREEFA
jgi:hypothetical protein